MSSKLVGEARPTRFRVWILVAMVAATFANYLDRAVLAVVGPTVQKEFGLSDVQYGWLSSAFVRGIVVVILVFGVLMQKFGERIVGFVGLVGFGLMTLLSGGAVGFKSLMTCRLGLGVFEAPTFPMNATLARRWFPPTERAKSVSSYQFAVTCGTALGIPIVAGVTHAWGWRGAFVFTGIVTLLVSVFWQAVVRDTPQKAPRVNRAEVELIQAGGGEERGAGRTTREHVKYVLSDRRLIALCIITGATSTAFFFFMTWLPKYMREAFDVDVTGGLRGGVKGTIPYLCALVGIVFGGWISDHLVARGVSRKHARKVPIMIGLALTAVVLVMPFAHGQLAGLVIISIGYFGAAMGNCAWILPAEVSRKECVAVANSVYGFCTNLFGAISPVVAGYLVSLSGYNAMMVYIGAWAVVGLVSIVLVLDEVAPTPAKNEVAA